MMMMMVIMMMMTMIVIIVIIKILIMNFRKNPTVFWYLFLFLKNVVSQHAYHNSLIIIKYGFHRAFFKLQTCALVLKGSQCCYGNL